VALGVAVESRPFAKSTLQELRAQLILHAEQRALFQRSLELARQRGQLPKDRQLTVALDTTNSLGRGAVQDTYNLLADGIRRVLRVLAAQAGQPLDQGAAPRGFARYGSGASVKGRAAVDGDEEPPRREFLQELVADAERLLALVRAAREQLAGDRAAERALVEAAGLLSRVLGQDLERRAEGPVLKEGVAPDRLVSGYDPERRHGRKRATKRFDGHKAAVAADTDSQLITAVDVLAGNAPDSEDAVALVEQTEENTGGTVAEAIGDCA
jgi:hypothetical protein